MERSLDGINFEVVERVEGMGTTDAVNFYDLVDVLEVLKNDMLYYRLKQVDFDGTTSYSEIKAVRIEYTKSVADVNVFPNPAVDKLNVSFDLFCDESSSFIPHTLKEGFVCGVIKLILIVSPLPDSQKVGSKPLQP